MGEFVSAAALREAPDDALDRQIENAFQRETQTGVLIAMAVRVLSISLNIAIYFWNLSPLAKRAPMFFHLIPMSAFLALIAFDLVGIVLFGTAARSRKPLFWCIVLLLIDLIVVWEYKFGWLWKPEMIAQVPVYISVRYLDIEAFALLVMMYALPLSPRVLLLAGGGSIGLWVAGIARSFFTYPHAAVYWGPFGPGIGAKGLAAIQSAEVLVPDYFILQILLIGVFTYIFIASSHAARRFVVARVRAETSAAFLTRFFPPALAAKIAADAGQRIAPGRRHAAILFTDQAKNAQSGDLAKLQSYYAAVEAIAFAHDGIVDRFTGGPIMISFGTLESDPAAVENGLACALDLARMPGETFVAAHAGSVISGELGGTRGRVFSVVGDAVNTARRVLDVSRTQHLPIVVTEDAVRALRQTRDLALSDIGATVLRGRDAPVHLWSVQP